MQLKGVATIYDLEEGQAKGVIVAQMAHIAIAESICTALPPINQGANISSATI